MSELGPFFNKNNAFGLVRNKHAWNRGMYNHVNNFRSLVFNVIYALSQQKQYELASYVRLRAQKLSEHIVYVNGHFVIVHSVFRACCPFMYRPCLTRNQSLSCGTASNIIFVDSPAGVGYSYSNTSSDYNYLDDDLTGAVNSLLNS